MFQDLATNHRVERCIGIGNGINFYIAERKRNPFAIDIRMDRRLILNIESMTLMSKFPQQSQKKSVTRPYIQYPRGFSQRHGDITEPVDAPCEHIFKLRVTPVKQPAFVA